MSPPASVIQSTSSDSCSLSNPVVKIKQCDLVIFQLQEELKIVLDEKQGDIQMKNK